MNLITVHGLVCWVWGKNYRHAIHKFMVDVHICILIFWFRLWPLQRIMVSMFCSAKFQKATILLILSYLLKLMSVPLCGQTENNIYTDKEKKALGTQDRAVFADRVLRAWRKAQQNGVFIYWVVIKITFCMLSEIVKQRILCSWNHSGIEWAKFQAPRRSPFSRCLSKQHSWWNFWRIFSVEHND